MALFECSITVAVVEADPTAAAHAAQGIVLDALGGGEGYTWTVEEVEGPNIGTVTTVDTEEDEDE